MQSIFSTLKYRSVQVLLMITFYLLIASSLPPLAHQWLYTISVFIKDILVWMLPLTVGFFIAHAVYSFHRKAPLFIAALILFEALSNLSSVWFAFGAGQIAADYLPPVQLPTLQMDFSVLWRLPFIKPSWWSADKGTLFGLLLGCVATMSGWVFLKEAVERGKEIAQWILTQIFSRLIPFFVLGFVARMQQTQVLHHIFAHYGMLILSLLFFLGIYLSFLFFLASDGTLKGAWRVFKNLFSAGA
ncbi:MAG: hypothetical protein V4487_05190, partial [Chlamydiota bacterium]